MQSTLYSTRVMETRSCSVGVDPFIKMRVLISIMSCSANAERKSRSDDGIVGRSL
jgi:hypothetical protein